MLLKKQRNDVVLLCFVAAKYITGEIIYFDIIFSSFKGNLIICLWYLLLNMYLELVF